MFQAKSVLIVAIGSLCLASAIGQAPLGTAFTYQGKLDTGGNPANGLYDLRFSLFDAASGGSVVAGPICSDNFTVVEGLFTIQLDFGSAVFDGRELWLLIEVRAGGAAGNCSSGSYTALSPRQSLTSAPYALGLRLPYAGQASVQSGSPVHVTNTFAGPLFTGYGLWGETVHPAGRGVYGLASTATGASIGIYGEAASNQGIGVFGFAPATTTGFTPSYGVGGRSSCPIGRGIFGYADSSTGTNFGVYGQTNSASGYAGYFDGGRNYFSGNVGIGTTDPTAGKLEVVGLNYGVYSTATSTTSGAGVYGNGKYGVFGIANHTAGFGGVFTGAGDFGAGNSLWVTGIARIGDSLTIGGSSLTATPAARLQVESGLDASLGGGGFAVLGDTSAANIAIDDNEIMARNNGAVSSLFINHNGGDVIVSGLGTGRVGIGTTTPAYELDVDGAIRPQSGIYFNGALEPYQNAQGGNFLSFGHPGFSEDHIWYYDNVFRFYDSPGGGDAEHPIVFAGDFYTYSDIRLKTDVEPIHEALDKVRQLRGIRYRFDPSKVDPQATVDPSKPGRLHVGFAAQEVEQVVPEAVSYSPEMDVYAVSYGSLVPVLVEAIKEQQGMIDAQQARLDAQQTMIDALRTDVSELKARQPR